MIDVKATIILCTYFSGIACSFVGLLLLITREYKKRYVEFISGTRQNPPSLYALWSEDLGKVLFNDSGMDTGISWLLWLVLTALWPITGLVALPIIIQRILLEKYTITLIRKNMATALTSSNPLVRQVAQDTKTQSER